MSDTDDTHTRRAALCALHGLFYSTAQGRDPQVYPHRGAGPRSWLIGKLASSPDRWLVDVENRTRIDDMPTFDTFDEALAYLLKERSGG